MPRTRPSNPPMLEKKVTLETIATTVGICHSTIKLELFLRNILFKFFFKQSSFLERGRKIVFCLSDLWSISLTF